MKKRGYRSVNAVFALKALGFIPAALLVEFLAELLQILDLYIVSPGRAGFVGFRIFYFFAVLYAGGVVNAFSDDFDDKDPVLRFVLMVRNALFAGAVILLLNLAGSSFFGNEGPGFLILVSCLSAVILGGLSAFKYVSAGREYVREHLDELSWYPEDREILIRYALMGRRTAQEKLPWPEEKETLRAVALSDKDPKNRAKILQMLSYPEEKETLRAMALEDGDPKNRAAALQKLPWPEERETLVRAVMQDEDRDIRWQCLEKLPWPQEKEACLSFIEDCEKTLSSVHQNKVEEAVAKTADRLKELYRRTGSSKNLINLHKGSNPHRDSVSHYDEGDDYIPSCTEFTDEHIDEHSDYASHDDAEHDDYFVIGE